MCPVEKAETACLLSWSDYSQSSGLLSNQMGHGWSAMEQRIAGRQDRVTRGCAPSQKVRASVKGSLQLISDLLSNRGGHVRVGTAPGSTP